MVGIAAAVAGAIAQGQSEKELAVRMQKRPGIASPTGSSGALLSRRKANEPPLSVLQPATRARFARQAGHGGIAEKYTESFSGR